MSKEDMDKNNISLQDIFGDRDSWSDSGLYDETINNFEKFYIEGLTIRPNGEISILIKD
jgi:hypothetical protein